MKMNSNIRRQVRFSTDAEEIHPIDHRNDMDPAEIQARWYGRDDIAAMMRRADKVTDESEQRGLELRTERGLLRFQNNRSMALKAVLKEQQRQRIMGKRDEELLSEIYQEATYQCQIAAFALGVCDEAAIKKDQEKLRRMHTRKETGEHRIGGVFNRLRRFRRSHATSA